MIIHFIIIISFAQLSQRRIVSAIDGGSVKNIFIGFSNAILHLEHESTTTI